MPKKTTNEERIYFEKLLTELSASFVKTPLGRVDEIVEGVLRHIGKILEIDRTDFVQPAEERGQVKFTHSWTTEGIQQYPSVNVEEYPWLIEAITNGKDVIWSSPDDLPEEAHLDKESLKKMGIISGMAIPYTKGGSFVCAIAFGSHSNFNRAWSEEDISRIRLLGEVISNALMRQDADLELSRAFSEIKALKDQLKKENVYLREEIKLAHKHEEIIGNSDGIRRVLGHIEQVAETNSTVLIHGETGTGKELVARAIHHLSLRKDKTLVTVNCAALPTSLVEAELFGREKGAYTGAISKQIGRFEIADRATLFLDEIGELPMELQVKLLRVLQSGQFERLGSSKTMRVDVRVITATNKNLEKAIREGRFREDLFYRLNVFPIEVLPLRERGEDILPLTWAFVKEFSENMGKRIKSISRTSLNEIQRYHWPGNIRELRNVIERAMITCKGGTLTIDVPSLSSFSVPHNLPIEEYERRYILKILEQTGWRIRGERGAAEILGLKPTTLHSRMKKHAIQRPRN
jgi:formate hydrogenlyase transcriptional activator